MAKAQQFEEFIDCLGLRHFKGNEFTPYWSSTRKGVKNSVSHESLWPNIIPTHIVLDELRERLGTAINFNSTYRSPAYNTAVGGEPASFHMQFRAIDFRGDSGTPQEWAKQLRPWRGKQFSLPENGSQFTLHGGVGLYSTFVHVDT